MEMAWLRRDVSSLSPFWHTFGMADVGRSRSSLSDCIVKREVAAVCCVSCGCFEWSCVRGHRTHLQCKMSQSTRCMFIRI